MAHARNDLGMSVHLGETGNIKGKGLFKVFNLHSYVTFSMHRGTDLCPPKSHNIQSYYNHCFRNPKGNEPFLTPHTSHSLSSQRQLDAEVFSSSCPAKKFH